MRDGRFTYMRPSRIEHTVMPSSRRSATSDPSTSFAREMNCIRGLLAISAMPPLWIVGEFVRSSQHTDVIRVARA